MLHPVFSLEVEGIMKVVVVVDDITVDIYGKLCSKTAVSTRDRPARAPIIATNSAHDLRKLLENVAFYKTRRKCSSAYRMLLALLGSFLRSHPSQSKIAFVTTTSV